MSQQTDLRPALLVKALLAYSVHEHQLGHAQNVELCFGLGNFTLQDDGRGMGLEHAGYVEDLLGTLVGGRGDVQLHGVGLSLVAASAEHLRIESCRADGWWSQSFRHGVAMAEPSVARPCPRAGTRLTLMQFPAVSAAEMAEIEKQVAVWRTANPRLTITIHTELPSSLPVDGG